MPFVQLEARELRVYRIAQVILYLVTFTLLALLIVRSLFPTTLDTFDFENPTNSKHTLLPPVNQEGHSADNGKLLPKDTLSFQLGASAEDEEASFKLLIEEKNSLPENLSFRVRHGYQAAWLPQGDPISDFLAKDLYLYEGTYYSRESDRLLKRFSSREAFLSRYPEEFAKTLTPDDFAQMSVSEEVIGFRPGVLTAYGEGVFIIMNEKEMRPVGSARIFQDLGFRFEDVQKINAEELGIYERGKIFLSGDRHPEGTLFQDQESGRYFLLGANHIHEVLPGRYLDFLLTKTHPILFSLAQSHVSTACTATPLLFSHGISCSLSVKDISASLGSNYEILLENPVTETDARYFEARFVTAKNQNNFNFIVAQIKDLINTRFGTNF